MCGLAGCTTKNHSISAEQRRTRNNIVTAMHIAMQERGEDSAGIASITNGIASLYKRAVPAISLITEPAYIKNLSGDMIITHTRFATTGAITDKNAHPFRNGTIIGAHNGMVSNHLEIDNSEVDSEVIFSELNRTKNDYKSVFPRLSGQFAITWTDTNEPGVLYFVRHDNPLHVLYIKSLKTLFYCSTYEAMLPAIIAGNGIGALDVWEPKADIVYRIDADMHISKEKISFKTPVFTGKAWDKYDPMGKDIIDDYADSYEYDYSPIESIEWSKDNDVCELCSKPIAEPNFYADMELYTVMHVRCAESQGAHRSPDIKYFDKKELEYQKKLAIKN